MDARHFATQWLHHYAPTGGTESNIEAPEAGG